MRAHSFDLSSVALTEDNLRRFAALFRSVVGGEIDYQLLGAHAPLLVDCRGKFPQPADNIIRA